MNNNKNNTHILNFDLELDESLYLLTRAAGTLREIKIDFDKEEVLKSIGRMIFEIHLIRDELHKYLPYLIPHLGEEMEKDMQRYEKLQSMNNKACNLLENNQLEQSQTAFEELWQQAEYGYFQFIAEVNLYECQQKMQNCFNSSEYKFYQTFDDLNKIFQQAQQLEQQKDFQAALNIYQHLIKISKYQQFELLGQAGAYRCEKALNSKN